MAGPRWFPGDWDVALDLFGLDNDEFATFISQTDLGLHPCSQGAADTSPNYESQPFPQGPFVGPFASHNLTVASPNGGETQGTAPSRPAAWITQPSLNWNHISPSQRRFPTSSPVAPSSSFPSPGDPQTDSESLLIPSHQSWSPPGLIADARQFNGSFEAEYVLQLPENTVKTIGTSPLHTHSIEGSPRQAAERLADQKVRSFHKARRKDHNYRRPALQDGKQSRISKNISRNAPKRQALSEPALQKVLRDESGNMQGVLHTFGARQRGRSELNKESRISAAITRQRHACLRCRVLKKTCLPGEQPEGPCQCCFRANPYKLKMPCLREGILDAALFRLRPPEDDPMRNWTRRQHIFELRDDNALLTRPRQIILTQDMGITLTVSVAMFAPEPGDKTGYTWEDENGAHTMEMPHFYIVDYQDARRRMLCYIEESSQKYLEKLLDPSNKILWETFQVAVEMGGLGKRPMLQRALSLWSAGRIIERLWRICGDDTLGFDVILDHANPWQGMIPIPPIMDPQLDQLVIQGYLLPLKERLLRQLSARVNAKSKEDIFEIYLTIFILLSNAEQMLAHTRRFAQRYGMSGRFGPFGRYSLAESYFHASKILLSYFHFACRGSVLFSHDLASLDFLTPDQMRYVEWLKKLVKEKETALLGLRSNHKYETNLYWSHQLLLDNWSPGLSNIEEVDPEHDDPV